MNLSGKNHISFAITLLLAAIFYSCTASNENITEADITFDQLKSLVNANSKKLHTLDADGEIAIESPNLSNTGTITVSIRKPDSVFTKLEGPFGVDVAHVLITRNNFIYYNVMDNKVITGPSTQRNLGIIMRIKMDFDDIVNAFSGKFTFSEDTLSNVKIARSGDNYLVTINTDDEIKKYWINSDAFYVTKLGTYDKNGNVKIEILYENFYQSDDIFFPKKITVNRPKENQNIWLTYSREKFNGDKLTFKLKIPKSARRIDW